MSSNGLEILFFKKIVDSDKITKKLQEIINLTSSERSDPEYYKNFDPESINAFIEAVAYLDKGQSFGNNLQTLVNEFIEEGKNKEDNDNRGIVLDFISNLEKCIQERDANRGCMSKISSLCGLNSEEQQGVDLFRKNNQSIFTTKNSPRKFFVDYSFNNLDRDNLNQV